MPHTKAQVCRLQRTVYGLKQASCALFENSTLLQLGFINSPYDLALFTHASSSGKILLFLHVDNMIITRDNTDDNAFLKDYLAKFLEMKDLGLPCYFIGIEITSSAVVTYCLKLNIHLIYLPVH